MNTHLNCQLTRDAGHRAVLQVRGQVDLTTADQLRQTGFSALARHDALVLDVASAMFLDSAGIRALHALAREARRRGRPAPILRGMRPSLAASLTRAGLHEAFTREPAPAPTLAQRPAHTEVRTRRSLQTAA